MNQKISALIFISLLSFILASCEAEEEEKTGTIFKGGTDGIIASFETIGIEQEGRNTIFENEAFAITLKVLNKGEYDVEANELKAVLKGISLSDYDNIVSGGARTNAQKIEAISEFNTEGGETSLEFTTAPGAKYKNKLFGGRLPVDIFADIEYKYQTKLVIPKVCHKQNPRDTRICNVEGIKEFSDSGAPVTVESVEEGYAGANIIFLKIMLKNNGFASGARTGLPNVDFNSVQDLAALTPPSDWTCVSGGRTNEARFVNGVAEVRCKINTPLEKDALFEKKFDLSIDYKYKVLVQQALQIKTG